MTSSMVTSLGWVGSVIDLIASLTLSLISAWLAPVKLASVVSIRIWRAFLSTSLRTLGSELAALGWVVSWTLYFIAFNFLL